MLRGWCKQFCALRERGQSEVLGATLLTGIIVVLVALGGLFLFADFEGDDEQLLANIEGEITATDITLTHNGGDTFNSSEVAVVLTGDNERDLNLAADFNTTGGSGELAPGDVWEYNTSGDIILGEGRLLVIHEPTNTVLYDESYLIQVVPNGIELRVESFSDSGKQSDQADVYGDSDGVRWEYDAFVNFDDDSDPVKNPDLLNISFNKTTSALEHNGSTNDLVAYDPNAGPPENVTVTASVDGYESEDEVLVSVYPIANASISITDIGPANQSTSGLSSLSTNLNPPPITVGETLAVEFTITNNGAGPVVNETIELTAGKLGNETREIEDIVPNGDTLMRGASATEVVTFNTTGLNISGTDTYELEIAGNEDSQTVNITVQNSTISEFDVTNPTGRDIAVEFESSVNLSDIKADISGAETDNLTDFTQKQNSTAYIYNATYDASKDGDYNITLDTAEYREQDVASEQSDTVTVSVISQDKTLVFGDSSGTTATSGNENDTEDVGIDDVSALGPSSEDLTGDGTNDMPYIDSNGNLKLLNGTGGTQTLVPDSDGSSPAESKTLMAVGQWNGSDTSVFYADDNNDALYRVDDSGSTTEVVDPGDGAQGVLGTGDIDDDGTRELIFSDGSQQVQYLESDGSVTKLSGGGVGSNNGLGVGRPPDFDGDGTVRALVVDGSNRVKLVGDAEPTKTFDTDSSTNVKTNAKKAPLTATDVDNDGTDEIVYIGNDDGKLKYVDDPLGNPTIEFLKDEDGNKISGDDNLGVVS